MVFRSRVGYPEVCVGDGVREPDPGDLEELRGGAGCRGGATGGEAQQAHELHGDEA